MGIKDITNDFFNNINYKSYFDKKEKLEKEEKEIVPEKEEKSIIINVPKQEQKTDKNLYLLFFVIIIFMFIIIGMGFKGIFSPVMVDNSSCITQNFTIPSCPVAPECPTLTCPNPIINVNYTIINKFNSTNSS